MSNTQQAERWRPIQRFPEYEASSEGRIRRIDATRTRPAGYVLRTPVDQNGYLKVCVFRSGKPSHTQVHRLVCEAFHGLPPSPQHQVAHGNGTRTDNRSTNLRWVTARENAADRAVHGTHNPVRGEGHPQALLTEEIVLAMRLARRAGEQIKVIAGRFGVAYYTACDAIRGRTWTHLPA